MCYKVAPQPGFQRDVDRTQPGRGQLRQVGRPARDTCRTAAVIGHHAPPVRSDDDDVARVATDIAARPEQRVGPLEIVDGGDGTTFSGANDVAHAAGRRPVAPRRKHPLQRRRYNVVRESRASRMGGSLRQPLRAKHVLLQIGGDEKVGAGIETEPTGRSLEE